MPFTLSLGEKAPKFNLPGVDGKNWSLDNFSDAKILVVVFSCNHCPFVVGSEDREVQEERPTPRGGVDERYGLIGQRIGGIGGLGLGRSLVGYLPGVIAEAGKGIPPIPSGRDVPARGVPIQILADQGGPVPRGVEPCGDGGGIPEGSEAPIRLFRYTPLV